MSTKGIVKGIISNLVIVEVDGPVAQNEIAYIVLDDTKLMAEVIKVGLIKSKELIDYLLEEKIDNLKMIQMAVKIKKEIVEEIENCVGSFRYHGDELLQEAATEVVETLLAALEV